MVTDNNGTMDIRDSRIDLPAVRRGQQTKKSKETAVKEMINALKGTLPIPGHTPGCRIDKREEKEKGKDKVNPADQGHQSIYDSTSR